jgi:hypothetical protein
MYRPNFCAECGTRLLRLRWHLWTSRKFCDDCARRLRKQRFLPVFVAALGLTVSGYAIGRAGRPSPPPLTIIRRADSPLTAPEDPGPRKTNTSPTQSATSVNGTNSSAGIEVYLCGARTKKGTPCSRRVHGPVRCWQHKGAPAMLPQEKLLVKDL